MLDGVQDPHNLGACLRTADACGALAVVVPKDRAAQLNATARKVAVGAAETTPVVAVTNLARTLKLLKEAGLWVVGADADGPKLAHEADLKGGVALVLGAEGAGLRQLTRQTCDFLVRLPQLGRRGEPERLGGRRDAAVRGGSSALGYGLKRSAARARNSLIPNRQLSFRCPLSTMRAPPAPRLGWPRLQELQPVLLATPRNASQWVAHQTVRRNHEAL